MTHAAHGSIRIPCPACRRNRVFLTAELFSPTRSFVTLRKACPHCGSDAPLPVRAPPAGVQMRTSLTRAVLRFDGLIGPTNPSN